MSTSSLLGRILKGSVFCRSCNHSYCELKSAVAMLSSKQYATSFYHITMLLHNLHTFLKFLKPIWGGLDVSFRLSTGKTLILSIFHSFVSSKLPLLTASRIFFFIKLTIVVYKDKHSYLGDNLMCTSCPFSRTAVIV